MPLTPPCQHQRHADCGYLERITAGQPYYCECACHSDYVISMVRRQAESRHLFRDSERSPLISPAPPAVGAPQGVPGDSTGPAPASIGASSPWPPQPAEPLPS